MKKMNKKSIALLICATLLLTFTVSGTVAYLVDASGPVDNIFTPGKVDTEIYEEFDDNGAKETIKIQNTADSIEVYVRVKLIANYVDDETGYIVKAATVSFTLGTGWVYNSNDGFYYYTKSVKPGETTENLLGSSISPDEDTVENAHLEVTVIHQSIQAEGMGATGAVDAFSKAASSTSTN